MAPRGDLEKHHRKEKGPRDSLNGLVPRQQLVAQRNILRLLAKKPVLSLGGQGQGLVRRGGILDGVLVAQGPTEFGLVHILALEDVSCSSTASVLSSCTGSSRHTAGFIVSKTTYFFLLPLHPVSFRVSWVLVGELTLQHPGAIEFHRDHCSWPCCRCRRDRW